MTEKKTFRGRAFVGYLTEENQVKGLCVLREGIPTVIGPWMGDYEEIEDLKVFIDDCELNYEVLWENLYPCFRRKPFYSLGEDQSKKSVFATLEEAQHYWSVEYSYLVLKDHVQIQSLEWVNSAMVKLEDLVIADWEYIYYSLEVPF